MINILSLFLLVCMTSICSSQNASSEFITVNQYSTWIGGLPNFTLAPLNNLALSKLNLPKDVSPLFSSLGYVSLTITFGVLLIGSIIGFALAQFFCKCFSDTDVKYVACERESGKLLMIALLLSVMIYSFISLYFWFGYYGSSWSAVDSFDTELRLKFGDLKTLYSNFEKLNQSVVNITLDDTISILLNASNDISVILDSKELQGSRSYQMWAPILFVIIVSIISIIGIIAVVKEVRTVVAGIGVLFFIFFIVQLVMTITGTSLTLIFSDVCARGIDNHTDIFISLLQNECAENAMKEIIFCEVPSGCIPFDNFETLLNDKIKEIQDWIDQSSDPKPEWKETITILSDSIVVTENLRECRNQQYLQITEDFCSVATLKLVLLSTIWQDTTAVMFIFMMVILYAWNRIKKFNDSIYAKLNLTDIELSSEEEQVHLQFKERSCSIGCFSFFVAMLLFWGGLIFSTIIIILLGSPLTSVPRS